MRVSAYLSFEGVCPYFCLRCVCVYVTACEAH